MFFLLKSLSALFFFFCELRGAKSDLFISFVDWRCDGERLSAPRIRAVEIDGMFEAVRQPTVEGRAEMHAQFIYIVNKSDFSLEYFVNTFHSLGNNRISGGFVRGTFCNSYHGHGWNQRPFAEHLHVSFELVAA